MFSVWGPVLKCMYLGGFNEAVTANAVNNSSLVFSIQEQVEIRFIFFRRPWKCEGGDVLLAQKPNLPKLRQTTCKWHTHGQHGVDRDFYEAVGAKFALWPTPKWLWENRADGKGYNSGNFKTFTVRQWMDELEVQKNYVSGLDGTVQID